MSRRFPPRDIQTQLTSAARNGDIVTVRMLMMRGANVDHDDGAALMTAAAHGHAHVIKVLVDEFGADVQRGNNYALRRAASMKHTLAVMVLIERGADPNAVRGEPLISAATWNMMTMAEILLEAGADVHVQDNLPLQRAHHHGHAAVVDLLLKHGADPFAVKESFGQDLSIRLIMGAQATERKIFLNALHEAEDKSAFLSGDVRGMYGFSTGEAGFIRAAKMGLLSDAAALWQAPVTMALLFDTKDRTGRPLISYLADQGELPGFFVPERWGGKLGDMVKCWERHWNGLDARGKEASALKPDDIQRRIALYHRAQLKNKAPKPPGL